ncbi:MAG: heme-copper oxidase subunit III [Actinobacteria bacterium]|nr:MAG: heme-copper oxidase subunit III [Actinomycetota bacterium]
MNQVAQRRRSLPNGVWGAILLIATEATLFGTLFATYFYLRFKTPQWPPAGIEPPSVTLPLVLTGILVCTSGPLFLASRAARAGRVRATWLLLFGALAVQAAYLGVQIHLFGNDLDKFTPDHSAYASIYFTLLGTHHFHVLVGILLEAWLLARLLRGLTDYRVVGVRAVSWYWHFVNLMALFVVGTQLSPSA